MNEQSNGQSPRYYDGDFPCPLAGTGKCCRERHQGRVQTTIDEVERANENHTDQPLVPKERDQLWINRIWQTNLGYDRKSLVAMTNAAIERNEMDRAAHLLDLLAYRKGVHTPANPDCPLLDLLREHKI